MLTEFAIAASVLCEHHSNIIIIIINSIDRYRFESDGETCLETRSKYGMCVASVTVAAARKKNNSFRKDTKCCVNVTRSMGRLTISEQTNEKTTKN